MQRIKALKKIFFDKKINFQPGRIYDITKFEDGKFIINIAKRRLSIYNKKYKLIFQKDDIFITSVCIINNNNFILTTDEKIYLYTEKRKEESHFFENEKDTTNLVITNDTDYKPEIIYDFGEIYFSDLTTIYSKKLNKIFIMKGKGIYCFSFYLNNKNIIFENILKIASCNNFILFRNLCLIIRVRSDDDEYLSFFHTKKMNQIWPKIEIQKCKNKIKNNLLNYSNQYFLFNDDNYLYVYDFDQKQISNCFSFFTQNLNDIKLTKNYIIMNDIINIFIYNRKNFYPEQTKKACLYHCFIEEIENEKIAVFRSKDILIFSKDKTFKIYFFMFLRIFIILTLLFSLLNSLYKDKFGIWYIIKNYLKFDLLVYTLFNYKVNNYVFISDFF